MTPTTLILEPTTVEDEDWFEVQAASPSVDDWLAALYGVGPGRCSPRCTPGVAHPAWAAQAGWLHAMWGFGV